MKIMKEEVFGPVLSIVKIRSDDEAVALANECDFGLGSNVFGSRRRALKVGAQLNAGMTTINDFCATYMAQSLPFGGVKESGFDRFAGIEGLRGCCNVKSVVVDGIPGSARTFPAAAVPRAALRVPVLQGAVPHVLRAEHSGERAGSVHARVGDDDSHAEGAPEGWKDGLMLTICTYDFNQINKMQNKD